MVKWNVVYFESTSGRRFVKEFIDDQMAMVRGKYAGMIEFLSEYGPFLTEKYTKKVRHNLYELRIMSKVQIRVLYTIYGRNIILLHAFKKKTQKAPLKEIKVALARLRVFNVP